MGKIEKLNEASKEMPDISKEREAQVAGYIDRVGMSAVEIPLQLGDFHVPAQASIFVNLVDPGAKGIHMSRLYKILRDELAMKELGASTLKKILTRSAESQEGLSNQSELNLSFQVPIKRKALVSLEEGWRFYPIDLKASFKNKTLNASIPKQSNDSARLNFEIQFEVVYSSTCPCSAALARQLVQEKFYQDFKSQKTVAKEDIFNWLGMESSVIATPHAQRSHATVRVNLGESFQFEDLFMYIDKVENILATPVQAAVKREDEQEFARLNATNLMFCEDAARRLKKLLDSDTNVLDYWAKVEHRESLHPHDAVSIVQKQMR